MYSFLTYFEYISDEVEEAGVDETSAQEEFEEKLKDCVEGLTQKR